MPIYTPIPNHDRTIRRISRERSELVWARRMHKKIYEIRRNGKQLNLSPNRKEIFSQLQLNENNQTGLSLWVLLPEHNYNNKIQVPLNYLDYMELK